MYVGLYLLDVTGCSRSYNIRIPLVQATAYIHDKMDMAFAWAIVCCWKKTHTWNKSSRTHIRFVVGEENETNTSLGRGTASYDAFRPGHLLMAVFPAVSRYSVAHARAMFILSRVLLYVDGCSPCTRCPGLVRRVTAGVVYYPGRKSRTHLHGKGDEGQTTLLLRGRVRVTVVTEQDGIFLRRACHLRSTLRADKFKVPLCVPRSNVLASASGGRKDSTRALCRKGEEVSSRGWERRPYSRDGAHFLAALGGRQFRVVDFKPTAHGSAGISLDNKLLRAVYLGIGLDNKLLRAMYLGIGLDNKLLRAMYLGISLDNKLLRAAYLGISLDDKLLRAAYLGIGLDNKLLRAAYLGISLDNKLLRAVYLGIGLDKKLLRAAYLGIGLDNKLLRSMYLGIGLDNKLLRAVYLRIGLDNKLLRAMYLGIGLDNKLLRAVYLRIGLDNKLLRAMYLGIGLDNKLLRAAYLGISLDNKLLRAVYLGIGLDDKLLRAVYLGISLDDKLLRAMYLGIGLDNKLLRAMYLGISLNDKLLRAMYLGVSLDDKLLRAVYLGISLDDKLLRAVYLGICLDKLLRAAYLGISLDKLLRAVYLGIGLDDKLLRSMYLGISLDDKLLRAMYLGIGLDNKLLREAYLGISLDDKLLRAAYLGIGLDNKLLRAAYLGIGLDVKLLRAVYLGIGLDNKLLRAMYPGIGLDNKLLRAVYLRIGLDNKLLRAMYLGIGLDNKLLRAMYLGISLNDKLLRAMYLGVSLDDKLLRAVYLGISLDDKLLRAVYLGIGLDKLLRAVYLRIGLDNKLLRAMYLGIGLDNKLLRAMYLGISLNDKLLRAMYLGVSLDDKLLRAVYLGIGLDKLLRAAYLGISLDKLLRAAYLGISLDDKLLRAMYLGISLDDKLLRAVYRTLILASERRGLGDSQHRVLRDDECEAGDPRENPPTSGIVRHDSHFRKSGTRTAQASEMMASAVTSTGTPINAWQSTRQPAVANHTQGPFPRVMRSQSQIARANITRTTSASPSLCTYSYTLCQGSVNTRILCVRALYILVFYVTGLCTYSYTLCQGSVHTRTLCVRALYILVHSVSVPATTRDYLRLNTTTCDYLRLPVTKCDYLRLPVTTCDYPHYTTAAPPTRRKNDVTVLLIWANLFADWLSTVGCDFDSCVGVDYASGWYMCSRHNNGLKYTVKAPVYLPAGTVLQSEVLNTRLRLPSTCPLELSCTVKFEIHECCIAEYTHQIHTKLLECHALNISTHFLRVLYLRIHASDTHETTRVSCTEHFYTLSTDKLTRVPQLHRVNQEHWAPVESEKIALSGDGVLDARGSVALIALESKIKLRVGGNLDDLEKWFTHFTVNGVYVAAGVAHVSERSLRGRSLQDARVGGMDQRRNARAGETGDPRGNQPTTGLVHQDSRLRKPRSDLAGVEPCSPWWEASRLTAELSLPLVKKLVAHAQQVNPVGPVALVAMTTQSAPDAPSPTISLEAGKRECNKDDTATHIECSIDAKRMALSLSLSLSTGTVQCSSRTACTYLRHFHNYCILAVNYSRYSQVSLSGVTTEYVNNTEVEWRKLYLRFHWGESPTERLHVEAKRQVVREPELALKVLCTETFSVKSLFALQCSDGITGCLMRRSDEALGVRVTVARIAPSLLDLGPVKQCKAAPTTTVLCDGRRGEPTLTPAYHGRTSTPRDAVKQCKAAPTTTVLCDERRGEPTLTPAYHGRTSTPRDGPQHHVTVGVGRAETTLGDSRTAGVIRPRSMLEKGVEWDDLYWKVFETLDGEHGTTGDIREYPPTSAIVRHDSHLRKSGDLARDRIRFALLGGEQANHSASAASGVVIKKRRHRRASIHNVYWCWSVGKTLTGVVSCTRGEHSSAGCAEGTDVVEEISTNVNNVELSCCATYTSHGGPVLCTAPMSTTSNTPVAPCILVTGVLCCSRGSCAVYRTNVNNVELSCCAVYTSHGGSVVCTAPMSTTSNSPVAPPILVTGVLCCVPHQCQQRRTLLLRPCILVTGVLCCVPHQCQQRRTLLLRRLYQSRGSCAVYRTNVNNVEHYCCAAYTSHGGPSRGFCAVYRTNVNNVELSCCAAYTSHGGPVLCTAPMSITSNSPVAPSILVTGVLWCVPHQCQQRRTLLLRYYTSHGVLCCTAPMSITRTLCCSVYTSHGGSVLYRNQCQQRRTLLLRHHSHRGPCAVYRTNVNNVERLLLRRLTSHGGPVRDRTNVNKSNLVCRRLYSHGVLCCYRSIQRVTSCAPLTITGVLCCVPHQCQNVEPPVAPSIPSHGGSVLCTAPMSTRRTSCCAPILVTGSCAVYRTNVNNVELSCAPSILVTGVLCCVPHQCHNVELLLRR
ncbi:hypothetical protein PR048_000008 [Dryococelus australis]|uniref:Uncharacterized protein n=1 Tax=Dryococelus australis TaxID=614101 RepID=A0ABQ9IDF3_9NEOP|nr:hypothetical protein PR048_000008 [Dryococelus australis]